MLTAHNQAVCEGCQPAVLQAAALAHVLVAQACASAMCGGCRDELPWAVRRGRARHRREDGYWIHCGAAAIRRRFPEVFQA